MKEYVQGLRRKLLKGPVFRKVLCILIVFCIFWANKYMAGISIYLNGARDSPPYLYVSPYNFYLLKKNVNFSKKTGSSRNILVHHVQIFQLEKALQHAQVTSWYDSIVIRMS